MIYVKNKVKFLMIFALLWMICTGSAIAGETRESVLGPGDALKIFVYGQPDLTTEARVSETGSITFPLLVRY